MGSGKAISFLDPRMGSVGVGTKLTKSLTTFFCIFQSSAYFAEGVQLLLEKGVVKCVETFQGFCLIDPS